MNSLSARKDGHHVPIRGTFARRRYEKIGNDETESGHRLYPPIGRS
jgi:hypothetical protein